MTSKPDIRDLSLDELTQHMASIGEKPYRAAQIFEWIYQKGAWAFDAMKNLPAELRARLKSNFNLSPNTIAKMVVSGDKTPKFLLDLFDHEKV